MITRLTVQSFRGISGREVFSPETLTVLTGRNGLGKTTFFDAIDWCLFGEASRLGSQATTLKNLYVPSDGPFVEVAMRLGSQAVTIARSERSLTLDGVRVTDRELAEALIVDPDVFPPYLRDLGRQVRTVSYLAQEQIRDFVSASLASERKALLRGLLGVPNAGLVESSVKRVKDHFAMRERRLVEEVDQLTTELSYLVTALNFDSAADSDAKEFVEAFARRFQESPLSLVDTRASLESKLEEQERTATSLEKALAAGAEAVTVLSGVTSELENLERRRQDSAKREAAAATTAQETAKRIAETADQQHKAVEEVATIEGRIANLSARFNAQQRKKALTAESESLAKSQGVALENVGKARKLADEAGAALREMERLAAEHQRQVALARERTALESRLADIRLKADALQLDLTQRLAELEQNQVAAREANGRLKATLLKRDGAAASHQALATSARRGAQIASLREQLIALLDGNETRCPLCGNDYLVAEELRRHVETTASGSEFDMDLQAATGALSEAETEVSQAQASERELSGSAAKLRSAIEKVSRDLTQTRIDAESVNVALRELGEPIPLSNAAGFAEKVADLRTKADLAGRSLAVIEEALRVAETKHSRVSAELAMLISKEPIEDVTSELISNERSRLTEGQRRASELAEVVQTIRRSQASIDATLADVRSELAGLSGRVIAEQERKERVLATFWEQCKSVGGPVARTNDVEGLRTFLAGRLASVLAEIAALKDLAGRMASIEHRLAVNTSVEKEQAQRRLLSEAQASLSTLHIAQTRFSSIADELESRSRSEADAAGSQHRNAIQDCINALYPHRHLNEVEVDFANGDLLVKDKWLAEGVRPEDYSSTGQSNVLALSVFLGLALRQTFSIGRFLLLDEPVQNLDDLHFLAFITLVKRIALSRQVIISTADSNVAALLRRQLRSWSASNRTWCEYEWVAFDPQKGPTVKRHTGRQSAVA